MAWHRGRQGRGRRRGSGTTTGALLVASRPKAGSATGLVRRGRGWCDGGIVGGVEAEGGDGAVSREAATQRAGNLGSLMPQTKISP
jgi:hypothetical protein